jgi:predicted O-linked N-acetylglucosamine transferase (SPINDLY family)
MNPSLSSHCPTTLQQQATAHLIEGQYHQAAVLYEQMVEDDPDEKSHYWYLGLSQLLLGHETEAQLVWAMALTEADPTEAEAWTAELIQILQTEAQRQVEQGNPLTAWAIRQHIHELNPTDLNNLLHSLQLCLNDRFTDEALANSGVIELLQTTTSLEVAEAQLLLVLQQVLEKDDRYPATLEFAQACSVHIQDQQATIDLLLKHAEHLGYIVKDYSLGCRYAEICLSLNHTHGKVLAFLAYFYVLDRNYERAIELARRCYELCQTLPEKIAGTALVLRNLLNAGGNWQEATELFEQQQALLNTWLQAYSAETEQPLSFSHLTAAFFYFPYFGDQPQALRLLQNQIAQRCQQNLEDQLRQISGDDYRQEIYPPRSRLPALKKLRIAYLSGHLRRHSIGWLARWLLQHYDRDRFEVYTYFMQQSQVSPFGQQWYVDPATRAGCFNGDALGIAQSIHEAEIDILIDLDSMSSDQSCSVMALKPAPIQVTWLGLDASGVPAIDYYIADPYVLPEVAQDYYAEKIWRLPQTYIAVDGFEVGTPSLRRDLLDIPQDAVIYFSAQTAFKRHPDLVRLQFQILKAVPNSYFLLKGIGDETAVKAFFEQIAIETGVPLDRLRFLPIESYEEVHRANLAIADVVLDTFPYNGATTTLETLWMGIPLVTKVGQQFAARNSYTMMINAGITEGIAWTDEEYLEWGTRLGQDAGLRQQISWKLQQSRHTAPLWNGKQFTREMEKAYEQMWQIHLQRPD